MFDIADRLEIVNLLGAYSHYYDGGEFNEGGLIPSRTMRCLSSSVRSQGRLLGETGFFKFRHPIRKRWLREARAATL